MGWGDQKVLTHLNYISVFKYLNSKLLQHFDTIE